MAKYTLRYLPTFYNDLEGYVMYISRVLNSVAAANELLNEIEKAILERLPNAEPFEPYHSRKERKYPYKFMKSISNTSVNNRNRH